jgi:drug/metabolite transporter (DMT)-like permease
VRGDLRGVRGGRTGLSTLAAGALLGLHFAAWTTSLQLTSVASSVVLVTTSPVFGALLSAHVLEEKASRAAWTGIALSVGGSALIAYGDYRGSAGHGPPAGGAFGSGGALLGDLLALAGAFFVAAYLTAGRSVRERAPLLGYLTALYATGAATVGLWAIARGDALGGYTPRQYLLFAAIAIVPNLIGHSLLNWGVRRMRTYVVNVAVLGEPVLATLYAALLFKEIPGPFWAAGALLIAAGVLTIFFAERSRSFAESELA